MPFDLAEASSYLNHGKNFYKLSLALLNSQHALKFLNLERPRHRIPTAVGRVLYIRLE